MIASGVRLQSKLVGAFVSFLLLALANCGGDSGTDPTPGDRVVTAIQMDAENVVVDDDATVRVSTTVRDQDGTAFTALPEGVTVVWTVTDGAVASVQPVGSGLEADLTGERPGNTQVRAAVQELSATATVTVNPVASELVRISGDDQESPAGAVLGDPLVVRVQDRHGDGVADVNVEFHVVSGGGSVSQSSVVSGPDGNAQVAWTLGPAEGEQTVEARAQGLVGSPALFRAVAVGIAETGSVSGVVTAANGVTPIQGARVRLATGSPAGAAAGSPAMQSQEHPGPEALTDVEGRFTLEGVPAGDQTLVATRGVFRAEVQVHVVAGQLVEAPVAALDAEGLAYVDGDFDSIEGIVRDELGSQLDRIDAFDLASPEVTSRYQFIFINCGVWDFDYAYDPDVQANILDFIAGGGAVYVSDLELPFVQNLFPDHVLDMDEVGEEQTMTAEVISGSLRDFIGGQPTVEITFNLDGWATIQGLSDQPDILLRGDYLTDLGPVTDGPLAIVIHHGAGQLVYTSFHTNAAATDDQISVLRYFIFGFGEAEPFALGPPVAMERSGVGTVQPQGSFGREHRGHTHRIRPTREP